MEVPELNSDRLLAVGFAVNHPGRPDPAYEDKSELDKEEIV
jgi:hypothetical protein